MWIDSRPFDFPPARLALRSRDDRIGAVLFSDDPPEAIDDDYAGNSFYLDMTPQLAETGTLAGAHWEFKAPNSERVDEITGIFLHGKRLHLQPFDVRVSFDGVSSPMTVLIAGTFLQFDSENDQLPGKLVAVRAELSAEVRVKGAAARTGTTTTTTTTTDAPQQD
jgi:hypothetical protein